MQKVQETTASGCLQIEIDSAVVVVGGKTCRTQNTVGRYFHTSLIGSMRMCRR